MMLTVSPSADAAIASIIPPAPLKRGSDGEQSPTGSGQTVLVVATASTLIGITRNNETKSKTNIEMFKYLDIFTLQIYVYFFPL